MVPDPWNYWKYSATCKNKIEARDTATTKNLNYKDGTKDTNIPEPRIVAVAECILTEMDTPAGTKMNREDFGVLVVFIDIFVVIIFFIFIWLLENGQERYVNQFEQQTIDMTDFAVRVKYLPNDKKYNNDE